MFTYVHLTFFFYTRYYDNVSKHVAGFVFFDILHTITNESKFISNVGEDKAMLQ